jgi:hypothetical protein
MRQTGLQASACAFFRSIRGRRPIRSTAEALSERLGLICYLELKTNEHSVIIVTARKP